MDTTTWAKVDSATDLVANIEIASEEWVIANPHPGYDYISCADLIGRMNRVPTIGWTYERASGLFYPPTPEDTSDLEWNETIWTWVPKGTIINV